MFTSDTQQLNIMCCSSPIRCMNGKANRKNASSDGNLNWFSFFLCCSMYLAEVIQYTWRVNTLGAAVHKRCRKVGGVKIGHNLVIIADG